MEITLDRDYPLDVDEVRAWRLLSDIPAMAACMPGAAITEQIDERRWKGTVKVKVGPASAAFAGEIELLEIDATGRTVRLHGKGADRGGSSASMDLTAVLIEGEAGGCVLKGHSDVIVNGKFAQFGGRMIGSVSDVLLKKFSENFVVKAKTLEPAAGAASAPATGDAPSAAAPTGATTEGEGDGGGAGGGQAASAGATAETPPDNSLNALALIWAVVRNFFAGLFGRRGG